MTDDDYGVGLEEYSKKAWDHAMHYLQMGWSIIPIRFSDKMPAIEWKRLQDTQPTEEEVTGWFEDGVPNGSGGLTKAFGLAVITGKLSGLVVVDCDNQDALTYAVTEANLFSMLTVATTRGQHLYFKHPGGSERVQNKAGGIGRDWPDVQGLDLRGDGGYVVAPPSVKFGEDGKFKHIYSFNCPLDELENFVAALTVYPGMRINRPQQIGPASEMSFDSLQLSAVKAYGATVWDDMAERIERMGRKMRDGDGRNQWLVRYVGECIATGMNEDQARVAAEQFEREFFEQPLPTLESETVINSVLTIDKRNHPEKYAKREEYDNKNETRRRRANAIALIRPNNLAELKRLSAGKKFLIDPFVPPQSIIQVVGFNGHGKSLWVLHTIWAAAKGMIGACKFIRDLPYHVVITALAKNSEDDNGDTKYLPMLQGNAVQAQVPGIFDNVFCGTTKTTKDDSGKLSTSRVTITAAYGGWQGKVRDESGTIQPVEETGDITTILLKMDVAAK